MTKLKKKYCIASFLFAVIVLGIVLAGSWNDTKVYAASMDPDSISSFTQTDGQKAASATSDNNNGLPEQIEQHNLERSKKEKQEQNPKHFTAISR